jgi:hypothetical protein
VVIHRGRHTTAILSMLGNVSRVRGFKASRVAVVVQRLTLSWEEVVLVRVPLCRLEVVSGISRQNARVTVQSLTDHLRMSGTDLTRRRSSLLHLRVVGAGVNPISGGVGVE